MLILLLMGSASAANAHDIIFIRGTHTFVVESEAEGAVVVERLQHGRGPATVDVSTTGGTATAGNDYIQTTRTLTLQPIDQADFTFPLTNDQEIEAPESVEIELSNPQGGPSLASREATVTLIDNDGPARVSFAATSYSAFENHGSIEFVVLRSGDPAPVVSVSYATSDGTALGAEDYHAISGDGVCPNRSTEGRLCFDAGQRVKRFSVELRDDRAQEGAETFQVSLTDPSGAEIAEPASATATIQDDESPSADQDPPVSYFHQPLHGRTYSSRALSDILGVVDDNGAGVKRVEVSLMKKLKGGSCRWLSKADRDFVKRDCDQPVWMKLKPLDSAGNFLYTLPVKLRTSRSGPIRFYKARSRGVDEIGNVESSFQSSRNLSRFEVR
jgi:hypothetical protein